MWRLLCPCAACFPTLTGRYTRRSLCHMGRT
nr:MAG TPA: hypothetical protein [Caudoviricetes sp.]